jgi:hypothetical protein
MEDLGKTYCLLVEQWALFLTALTKEQNVSSNILSLRFVNDVNDRIGLNRN